MNSVQVAHVRIQGNEFVFVPFSPRMASVGTADQQNLLKQMREICHGFGLNGEVVVVWQGPSGLGYLADSRYHGVLSKVLNMTVVRSNLNKKVSSPAITGLLAQVALDPFGAAPAATAAPSPAPAARAPQAAPSQAAADEHRSMPGIHAGARKATSNRVVTMLFSMVMRKPCNSYGSITILCEISLRRPRLAKKFRHQVTRSSLPLLRRRKP
jgi:hypothetical protein